MCCFQIFRLISSQGLMAVSSLHGSNFKFAKSRAMLGTLGPVARSRVSDLWSEQLDQPPSPAGRVACQQSL